MGWILQEKTKQTKLQVMTAIVEKTTTGSAK